MTHYLKALAITPNRVEAQYNSQLQARFNLGVIYLRRGQLPDAETQFREVLKTDAGNENAFRALAAVDTAFAQKGQFAEAIAVAQKTRDTAVAQNRKDIADAAEKRLKGYRAGKGL